MVLLRLLPGFWVSGYQVPRQKKQWTKPSVCNSNLFFLVVSQPICVYCVYVNIYIYTYLLSQNYWQGKRRCAYSVTPTTKSSHMGLDIMIFIRTRKQECPGIFDQSVLVPWSISQRVKNKRFTFWRCLKPWMTWSLAKPITWLQQALLSKVHTTKMARSQCGPALASKGSKDKPNPNPKIVVWFPDVSKSITQLYYISYVLYILYFIYYIFQFYCILCSSQNMSQFFLVPGGTMARLARLARPGP